MSSQEPSKKTPASLFLYHLILTKKYQDPGNWSEITYQVIQEHAQFLEDLGKKGLLVFAGRTQFKPGDGDLFGIALIKANSLKEAQKIMEADPAVVNGIQVSKILPFSLGIRHLENLENSD